MINWLFTKTPLYFFTQSFWNDEAFSYLLAKKNIYEIIALSAKDFSPPLYYLIIHFWIKFFGSSEIALRLPSLIFFWATVYLGFLFLSEIFKFDLKKSFFYTFLIATNPLLIYYAFEARGYTLFAFLSTLSFYAFYKNKKNLYLISLILGLYTHYFMIFVILSQFLIKKSKEQAKAFIYFIPWTIMILFNYSYFNSNFWINRPVLNDLVNFIGKLYTGYESEFLFFKKDIFKLSLFLILIIFFGYFIFKNKKSLEKKLFRFLLIWGLSIPFLIILVSYIKPIFLPRYLIFANVGLILLLIFIVEKIHFFIKTIILIILISFTFNYHKLQIKERRKANLKTTITEIKKLMSKNDLLYVSDERDFFTAQYYLNEDKVFIWGKTYEEIPQYIGKALIPKNKVVQILPVYPNKAFILNRDGQYSIQAIY